MALKPLNDRIIVEPSEAETRTASGLVLPDSAQEKPQRGRVIAVGPGKRLDNGTLAVPDVSAGDTVLYGKYSGTEVKLAGKDYVILRAEDVLGILVGEGASKKVAAKPAKPAPKQKPAAPVRSKVSRSLSKAAPKAAKKTASKSKPSKDAVSTLKATSMKAKPAKSKPPKSKPSKKGKK